MQCLQQTGAVKEEELRFDRAGLSMNLVEKVCE